MTPRPASTVVIVRESSEGVQTLLLRRNSALSFEGGAWVFPGGKVDACDYPEACDTLAECEAEYLAAVNACIRETREEAGLQIAPDHLIHIAHWTTPLGLPRRYATWFFMCPLHEAVDIVVDDDEILDYQWLSPAAALQEHSEGRIRLPIPTAHTLKSMLPYNGLAQLCQAMRAAEIHVFPENSDYYKPFLPG
ncbi:MAG: NUDIX hydrolase [Pseudohongiella sp.]|nr:NUDIX hydrolase [Pseudohongiella sp.]